MKNTYLPIRFRKWIILGYSLLLISCGGNTANKKTVSDETGNTSTMAVQNDTSEKTTNPVSTDTLQSDPSQKVTGVDVSKYQGDIVWKDIVADGMRFAIAKATEGITYTDPDFKQNWEGMKSVDLIRGAYHFYRSNDDPAKQVDNFYNAVGELEPGDLPGVLDVENAGYIEGTDNTQFQQDVLKWLQLAEQKTGKKPIIYTNLNFANEHLLDPAFAAYKLWIAEYTDQEPVIPNTWKGKTYTFWQNSQSYDAEGISGAVDHDIFNGTTEELKALAQQ